VVNYDSSSGEAVVMSGWGKSSDWYRNVEAAGHARITVGRHTVGAIATVLSDPEAAAMLADYEKRNRWMQPIVHRVLSQLAGLHYDGTEESRLALVQKLPLVRFTPSPAEMATP
jgi:deazaflavin-dependent oxidoreductase (nitroreductase family)